MENLTHEELLAKAKDFEAIINDQQVLIKQLMEQNQKLAEIVTMQKEYINSVKGMMGTGNMMPPQ